MTQASGIQQALLAVLLGMVVSCGGKSGPEAPSASYDRDVIGVEEIATVEVRTTALQLIERFRPMWLQGRGPAGMSTRGAALAVYVNNQRVGDSPLGRYTAGELREIRFLNAVNATQRFGTGHGSGAILITTR